LYPNLDTEQARHGHTDEQVAGMLGLTPQEYRAQKASKTIRSSDAAALAEMYSQSTEYLFGAGAWGIKC